MKRNRRTESQREQVHTAYASGIGLREIARSTGIPAGTILAWAHREGWTRQLREARAIVPASAASPTVRTADAVAMTMQERGRRHTERVAGIVEKTLPALEAMEPVAVLGNVDAFDRLDRIGRRTYGLDDGKAGTTVNVAVALRLDME